MNSQTSLVAEQIRLQQWAEQIKDCMNRPAGMKVDIWCEQHGIKKATFYYRLRRVREECLSAVKNTETSFVELLVPTPATSEAPVAMDTVAILHGANGIAIEIRSSASAEFINKLIGAMAYAK